MSAIQKPLEIALAKYVPPKILSSATAQIVLLFFFLMSASLHTPDTLIPKYLRRSLRISYFSRRHKDEM